MTRLALVAIAVASCSSDKQVAIDASQLHDTASPHDAMVDARHIDAAPIVPDAATDVVTIACPSGVVPTVTVIQVGPPQNDTYAYSPMVTTIAVGGIVKFETTGIHDVSPDGATACTGCIRDPGLDVRFNLTECKQFNVAAKYGFACSVHNFKGSVVVQ